MVDRLEPLLIPALACAAAMLAFYSFGERMMRRLRELSSGLAGMLDRADVRMSTEELALAVAFATLLGWIAVTLLLKPNIVQGLLALPFLFGISCVGFSLWLDQRYRKRLDAFNQQLEMVLRMLASALRVGLGLRQALVLVAQQTANPTRKEFERVIGQTNIGIPINDALEDLRLRMRSPELDMMVRGIRIQSRSGGDLSVVLEHLATTIKERRKIHRKVRALTSEGRSGAVVLLCIPIFIATYIYLTQPKMGHAMIDTAVGRIGLAAVVILEIAGGLIFRSLLRFEV